MSRLELASGWSYEVRRRADGEYDLRPTGSVSIEARQRHGSRQPDGKPTPAWPLRTRARRDGRLDVLEVIDGMPARPAREFWDEILYPDGARLRHVAMVDARPPLFDSRTGEPL